MYYLDKIRKSINEHFKDNIWQIEETIEKQTQEYLNNEQNFRPRIENWLKENWYVILDYWINWMWPQWIVVDWWNICWGKEKLFLDELEKIIEWREERDRQVEELLYWGKK